MKNYLQNIPQEAQLWGIAKILLVRREIINLKHIKKEIFIKRTVNIHKVLENLNISLFEYNQYLVNRENIIFKFSRDYTQEDVNMVVKLGETFKQLLQLYKSLPNVIICTDFNYPALKYYQISPNIHSLREAIEFTQNKSMVLFISDNKKSLTNAWCFGVKTFLIEGNNIRHFSLKTT